MLFSFALSAVHSEASLACDMAGEGGSQVQEGRTTAFLTIHIISSLKLPVLLSQGLSLRKGEENWVEMVNIDGLFAALEGYEGDIFGGLDHQFIEAGVARLVPTFIFYNLFRLLKFQAGVALLLFFLF